jgi:AraC-like DNA-binding protein
VPVARHVLSAVCRGLRQPPQQFLLLLRMQLAARRLAQGEAIGQVAEAVGYESYAAFSRAFKRVMGEQPGAWQRAQARCC